MNVNFGLFPPLENRKVARRYRGMRYAERALRDIKAWKESFARKEPSS
jgi:methylenetetrahydrofolate--tRNA-(uracil-5-)-methyltransferase